jgi:hypothetical protein
MARFGLTEADIYEGTNRKLLGYLFDQYVRACGFEPTGSSWVFIVKPTGQCEYHPLAPGEPRWCCEQAAAIREIVGKPTEGAPPWETERTWACPPLRAVAPGAVAINFNGAEVRRTFHDRTETHDDGAGDHPVGVTGGAAS